MVESGRSIESAMVRLWPGDDERSCCSPGAVDRARASAAAVGVPFHLLDGADDFVAGVVEPFVAAYLAGETPNPCTACNPRRLAALVRLADELGLERVATGHYARLVWRDGEPFVARGADRTKDQSYMLWAVPPEVLARLEFPLGDSTKREVRAAAEAAGLPVAGQPESQEVCFAPDGYRAFLQSRGVRSRPGTIVDASGRRLGGHEGHWLYTVGQRRGLGVSAARPLYVLERRAATNEVVLGPRAALDSVALRLREVVDRGIGAPGGLTVQLRYRSPARGVAAVERLGPGRLGLRLATPFDGVAPGQSAVFYRRDTVVGGGVIEGATVRDPGASAEPGQAPG